MAKLSISESARQAGVARSTLYEYYIKPGKISVEIDGRGNKVIDVAELIRVFGELKGVPLQHDNSAVHAPGKSGQGHTSGADETRQLAGQVLALQAQVEGLRQVVETKEQVLAAKDEALATLRQNNDDLRSALEERAFQVLQLENKLQSTAEEVKPVGWFRRIFS